MDSRAAGHEGTISRWDDERGFGYITPTAGGRDVFAHISAWPRAAGRPTVGDFVTFETELAPDGRTRASRVRRPYEAVHRRPAGRGSVAMGIVAVLAFVALYALVSRYWWPVSPWIAVIYGGASLFTFVAYARDKAAARAGRWRTSENLLHLCAVLGGWPGAIIAQHFLHHKNRKSSFQAIFWLTVAVNVAAFVLVSSPLFWAGLATLAESAATSWR